MAKELPNTNAPPGVFQMFNEHRTFYFESDISSIPHLPCTLPAQVVHPSKPKLQKCLSQPLLSVTSIGTGTRPHCSPHPAGNLHIPAAIMATTTAHQAAFHPQPGGTEGRDPGSLESRYQTEPAFGHSSILKSFRQEFSVFGHTVKRASVSAPTSPRRASSPELELPSSLKDLQVSRDDDASRKLSLVKEETDKEVKEVMTQASGARRASEVTEAKSVSKPLDVNTSLPSGSVGGELIKDSERSLTKKMMTWFVTPQNQAKTTKSEYNAITPSSF